MRKFHILGVPALILMILATDAMAQRRGGGAVSGGVRGAMVGGLVGGSEGAQTGARIGAVTGATRAAVNREAQSRAEYQTSAAYLNAPHSDFMTAPPQVLVTTPPATAPPAATEPAAGATAPGGEALVRKAGKPVVGVAYPSDWKQRNGDRFVSAVSADGQAYSMIVALDGVTGKEAGIAKVKQGLEHYLQDIKFDDPTETKRGNVVITGTGKGKKSGVAVVFAAGVLDAAQGNSPEWPLSSMPGSSSITKKLSARSARQFASASRLQRRSSICGRDQTPNHAASGLVASRSLGWRLQAYQKHWLRLICPEVQKRRCLLLRQVVDTRFENKVRVLTIGELRDRTLAFGVYHPLHRAADLRVLIVIVVGASEDALLVDGELEHRRGVGRVLGGHGVDSEGEPLVLGIRLVDGGSGGCDRLRLLIILLGRAGGLPIHVDGVVFVVHVAPGAIAAIDRLRAGPGSAKPLTDARPGSRGAGVIGTATGPSAPVVVTAGIRPAVPVLVEDIVVPVADGSPHVIAPVLSLGDPGLAIVGVIDLVADVHLTHIDVGGVRTANIAIADVGPIANIVIADPRTVVTDVGPIANIAGADATQVVTCIGPIAEIAIADATPVVADVGPIADIAVADARPAVTDVGPFASTRQSARTCTGSTRGRPARARALHSEEVGELIRQSTRPIPRGPTTRVLATCRSSTWSLDASFASRASRRRPSRNKDSMPSRSCFFQ